MPSLYSVCGCCCFADEIHDRSHLIPNGVGRCFLHLRPFLHFFSKTFYRQSNTKSKPLWLAPQPGGQRSWDAWEKKKRTVCWEGSHILFLGSHHGNVPISCQVSTSTPGRVRDWSSHLVKTKLPGESHSLQKQNRAEAPLSQEREKECGNWSQSWGSELLLEQKIGPEGPLSEAEPALDKSSFQKRQSGLTGAMEWWFTADKSNLGP